MRFTTVILSIMLFIASTNVSSAMHSVMELMGSASSSCCSTMVIDSKDAEESSCCKGGESDDNNCCQDNCACTCCLQIVFYKTSIPTLNFSDYFFSSDHSWKFNYYKEYNHSIFHPPLA